jgi:hypothetical protein
MHALASPEKQPALLATARILLIMLVAADLAFIVLHVIYVETSLLRGRPFSLEADNGLPEAYQYVKQFWVALCMIGLYRRTREITYVGVGVVFAFLLMDDAFQIHEHFGKWLAAQYTLPVAFGLRPDDIGELLFAAGIGVVTFSLIGIGYWRGGPDARIVTRDISILILLLAGLGVGVDVIHVISYFKAPLLAQFLLILEDGGEMIVVSMTAAYVFNVLIHEGRAPVDLWAIIRDFASQRLLRRDVRRFSQ